MLTAAVMGKGGAQIAWEGLESNALPLAGRVMHRLRRRRPWALTLLLDAT